MNTKLRLAGLDRGERMLMVLMASAFACVALSLAFGALGALVYVPEVSARFVKYGVSLVQLRPLHTTFASAWIFLAAVAGAYAYLFHEFGPPSAADARRFRVHMVLWGLAGLAAVLTLPFGITSGREYLALHPLISLAIWVGWAVFAWSFLSKVRQGFFARPVYVYMWSVGILYFLWTFAEGHAYLLPWVADKPISDLQIQWKSCGTLVASFNQMVYASLMFLAVRKTGDESLGHSRTAFWLFGVGLLNSFTNYAHHTYHLPQSHLIKWVAFGASMLEVILLVLVLQEVVAALRKRFRPYGPRFDVSSFLVGLSKRWNLGLLTLAIAISVPPLNALIHGTHVVMAHGMGSELAIDSYILLAIFAFLLTGMFPKREVGEELIHGPRVRSSLLGLNGFLLPLVVLLVADGVTVGVYRYFAWPKPVWVDVFPFLLVILGLGVAFFFLRLVLCWLPLFRAPARFRSRHQLTAPDPPAARPEPAEAGGSRGGVFASPD